jgi:hypothetical protein
VSLTFISCSATGTWFSATGWLLIVLFSGVDVVLLQHV